MGFNYITKCEIFFASLALKPYGETVEKAPKTHLKTTPIKQNAHFLIFIEKKVDIFTYIAYTCYI